MMPLTLTLIRHGESESNAAKDAARRGIVIPREKELMTVHTSERRLTPLGERQAQAAGEWMRNWLNTQGIDPKPSTFRAYVSPYVRAEETAGLMRLGVKWRMDNRLCERNWGDLDQLPHAEREQLYKGKTAHRKDHAFFWRAGDGETLQDVFSRIRDLIGTLHRECTNSHVLIVSHGETMWAWRTILEYWRPQDLRDAMLSDDLRFEITNCRIIQYSRIEDDRPDERLSKVRFINPMNPDDVATNHGWIPIKRREWSDNDLLEHAGLHERFLEPT